MTRFQNKLFRQTAMLGLGMSLAVTSFDAVGGLKPLDRYLQDQRAKIGQHFRAAPTDKLVYLDIDDRALDTIGAWPWPREDLAQIVDELRIAGARNVCFDVMFPEPQPPTATDPLDHDGIFAQALAELGKIPGHGVLMPISIKVNLRQDQPQLYNALFDADCKDLELDDAALRAAAAGAGLSGPQFDNNLGVIQAQALPGAMFTRIREELVAGRDMSPDALRSRLLPGSVRSGVRTDAARLLEKTLPKVISFQSLQRFTRSEPPGLPPLLGGNEDILPVPPLAAAASYSGFVDFWQADEGSVHSIPLCVMDRGRMFIQMGLAFACQRLGVAPQDLILKPYSVTIPAPGGPIVIPTHVEQAANGTVGMMLDIDWFGSADWQTMLDWPRHVSVKNHLPITHVWDICQIKPQIEANARESIEDIAVVDDDPDIRTNHPPMDDALAWNARIHQTIDNLAPGVLEEFADYINGDKNIDLLPKDVRSKVNGDKNLVRFLRSNSALVQQRDALRKTLHDGVNDQSVLVGWIASGGVDARLTPLTRECPGVIVHGTIFSDILTHSLLTKVSDLWEYGLTLLIGVLVGAIAGRFHPVQALLAAAALALAYLSLNIWGLYDYGQLDVGMAGPVAAAVSVWAICTLFRFIRESRERARITRRFSSYADQKLVNYVLDHPEQATFSGEERELTVVFTDLAGFTSVSEKLKQETVRLLNEYLAIMEPIVRKHEGLVNKFLGDGIMFFFGAPEQHPGGLEGQALAAVECVQEMQRAMIPFNEQLVARDLPTLKMRAGVSTGMVVVGDAGTPDRSDYTVIGDRVNFAARLESANKYTGTLVLLSDRTVELLGSRYLVRPVGRLQVVGKVEPVMTYEPLAATPLASEVDCRLSKMTVDMIDAYIGSRFADCIAAAKAIRESFGAKQDKLVNLYCDMCEEYLRNPPAEFMGQVKLESK